MKTPLHSKCGYYIFLEKFVVLVTCCSLKILWSQQQRNPISGFNETAAVTCSAEVSLLGLARGIILLNLQDGLFGTQGANFLGVQPLFSFCRVSGTIKRPCSFEINYLITPICMEIGIDWPIGRSHIDLHHWKHSLSTNSEENKNRVNKTCECAIKPIHVKGNNIGSV